MNKADFDLFPRSERAVALRVNGRYFVKFNKAGAVQTAWSLAGAELFLDAECSEVRAVIKRLAAKGLACSFRYVVLADDARRAALDSVGVRLSTVGGTLVQGTIAEMLERQRFAGCPLLLKAPSDLVLVFTGEAQ